MVLKAIYDLEIDTTKFTEFKKVFDRYQAELAKLPRDWQKIAAGAKDTRTEIEKLADAARRQAEAQQAQGALGKHIDSLSKSTAAAWVTISASASVVGKHIASATEHLRKWSTYTTLFSALLGGGGLYGFDRLAAAISTARRSALGLGISYGQQASFNVNYSRLINPQALLSNVAGAKYDVTSPAYTSLVASGVPAGVIQRGNAADISAALLQRLPQLFAGVNTKNPGLVGATAHAYGIDQLMSMQDLIAFLNATPEERRSIAEKAAQDAKTMDITEAAQRKWQDFTTQMSRAAARIQVTFADKLVAIEPGLEKLSTAFVSAVQAFANSGLLKGWIEGLSSGLETFASYIGTKEFQDKIESWAKWVADAAGAVWSFLGSLGITPALADTAGAGSDPRHGEGTGWGTTGAGVGRAPGAAVGVTVGGNYGDTQAGHEAFIRAYASARGVDPNFAVAVARAEGLRALSARNPNSASYVDIDPATGIPFSYGDFQLNVRNGLGVLARQQGIDPTRPEDWMRADAFSIDYMAEHGVAPWRGDRAVQAYQASGQIQHIRIQPTTGNNPVLSTYLGANPYTAPVASQ